MYFSQLSTKSQSKHLCALRELLLAYRGNRWEDKAHVFETFDHYPTISMVLSFWNNHFVLASPANSDHFHYSSSIYIIIVCSEDSLSSMPCCSRPFSSLSAWSTLGAFQLVYSYCWHSPLPWRCT